MKNVKLGGLWLAYWCVKFCSILVGKQIKMTWDEIEELGLQIKVRHLHSHGAMGLVTRKMDLEERFHRYCAVRHGLWVRERAMKLVLLPQLEAVAL